MRTSSEAALIASPTGPFNCAVFAAPDALPGEEGTPATVVMEQLGGEDRANIKRWGRMVNKYMPHQMVGPWVY